MPAPPPESEPAMISTRPFIAARGASLGGPHRRLDLFRSLRRGEDCTADVVDNAGQQTLVLALRHDADDRLGAGIANHEPALLAEPCLAGGDRPLDPRRLERSALPEAHIAQQLRHWLEDPAHLARMLAALNDRRQDLQSGGQPVAGR